jgi:hypothetical protein
MESMMNDPAANTPALERERHIENLLLDGSTHLWMADKFVPLIKSVLQQIPIDALEQLEASDFQFLAPEECLGRVTRLSHSYNQGDLVVFLSPELLRLPPEGAQAAIAHELAHVVLNHEEDASENAREDAEKGERDADGLVGRWGFNVSTPLFDRFKIR